MNDVIHTAADTSIRMRDARARVYANIDLRLVGISFDGSVSVSLGLREPGEARAIAAALIAAADACDAGHGIETRLTP